MFLPFLRYDSGMDNCPDCGRVVLFSWPIDQRVTAETCNPLSSPACWTQPNLQLVREPAARVAVLPGEHAQALEPPPLLELAQVPSPS